MNKITEIFNKFVKWLTFKKAFAIAYLTIIIVGCLAVASKAVLSFFLFLLIIFLLAWSINEICKDWW